jgi:hypothetical protein
MQKVIAVDFDDCICTNNWPGIGIPNWAVINELKEEKRRGSAIVLWTCRAGIPLQNAVEACINWGIELDAVNANVPERIKLWGRDSRKISADEYWDDLAVTKTCKLI